MILRWGQGLKRIDGGNIPRQVAITGIRLTGRETTTMSKKAQSERGKLHRDDHEETRNGGTSDGSGRSDDTNEPAEAEAVDDVTPTNEPDEEPSDRE